MGSRGGSPWKLSNFSNIESAETFMPLSSILAKWWGPGVAAPGSSANLSNLCLRSILDTCQHSCPYMKTREYLWYANAVKTVFYGWLLIMPHQIRHLILGCNPNSYAMAFFWKWLNIQSYSFAPELEWKSAHRKKKCKFFILESHRIGLRIIRQKETWSRALFHKLLLLEHLKWLKSMIISE